MKGCFIRRLTLIVAAAQLALVGPVLGHGGHSRWNDWGLEVQGGSFGVSLQKRLFQPGLEEEHCMRCRQYLEVGLDWDEFDTNRARDDEGDSDAGEVDSTAFSVGYRYYVLTGDGHGKDKEGLAAYLAVGFGRYDLDPGNAVPGYYAKAALEYPLTQSTREDGTMKRANWSITLSARYDEVELAESNLDEFSGRLGFRVGFPSKRDRQRTACQQARQKLLDEGATDQEILREKRPNECIEPDDGGGRTGPSSEKKGQGGESTSERR